MQLAEGVMLRCRSSKIQDTCFDRATTEAQTQPLHAAGRSGLCRANNIHQSIAGARLPESDLVRKVVVLSGKLFVPF